MLFAARVVLFVDFSSCNFFNRRSHAALSAAICRSVYMLQFSRARREKTENSAHTQMKPYGGDASRPLDGGVAVALTELWTGRLKRRVSSATPNAR
jgi:hypothetical protein